MSQQLVKKGANGRMVNVNPKSWIEAIKDKNTGQTLVEILQGFNMYFLPYNGNTSATRCLVPTMLRKKGLWITYVKYDGNVYTEWYAADELDDKSWGDSSNWRIGNNTLVGDITISANGNWVINGTETEFKAIGEKGNTPLLRVANNRLQVSYDLGDTYRDVTNNPVYTKFRWYGTTGDTQANNVGRIQASTDEGKTWTNMSNDFANNLHISRYIGVNESLPTSGIAEGTIYAKGPYYAEDDTLNDNPIYRLWVYAWKGNTLAWQDNGEFQSIAAGVVQETGDSETKVMSQKAVSEKLSELGSKVNNTQLSTFKDFIAFKGVIKSNDTWGGVTSSFMHIPIKVKAGDKITVKASLSFYPRFLSNYKVVNGGMEYKVGDLLGYKKEQTKTFVAPEGANYFILQVVDNDIEINYSILEINGFDLLTTLQSKFDKKMDADNTIHASIDSSLTSNVLDFHRYKGTIHSSGKWAGVNDSWNFILLRVKEGDKVKIESGHSFMFYFLSDFAMPVDGGSVEYTVGEIKGYNKSYGSFVYTVPYGAKFIPISVKANGVEYIPSVLEINGFDLLSTLQSKLNKKADSDVYIKIDNSALRVLHDYTRYKGTIHSSGKWAGVNDSWNHVVVKVNPGDTITLTPSFAYYFYFLSEYTNAIEGEDVQNSVGNIQGAQKGNENKYIVPDGAYYMPVIIRYNGEDGFPNKLEVNGYNLLDSLGSQISAIQSNFVETIEYIVDVNGTGDFTSLREAVEICYPNYPNTSSAKSTKEYILKIIAGTYDIRSYYTDDEWNAAGFKGLTLPRGCKLVGMGRKRSDVTITCTSETNNDKISTLNIEDDVAIENLTIYGNNVRYTIHDDYSYYPYANLHGSFRNIKNVDFIGENLVYNCVYGSGSKGGANWMFENCNFINKNGSMAFSTHDRNGYIENAMPENKLFRNCVFKGNGNNVIRLVPLTSLSEQNIIFEGCYIPAITIDATDATTSYNVRGFGNTKGYVLTFINETEIARESTPKFSDEITL